MRYFLTEKDSACRLRFGDEVKTSPLCSCCLIVVRYDDNSVYAQHCGGSDLEYLDPSFFNGQAVEAIMVSGPESEYQKQQAHKFQLKRGISSAPLRYYAFNGSNYPMPLVKVESTGKLTLENDDLYHLVSY